MAVLEDTPSVPDNILQNLLLKVSSKQLARMIFPVTFPLPVAWGATRVWAYIKGCDSWSRYVYSSLHGYNYTNLAT